MSNVSTFKLDFVGIGAQRAATTWIAECLREHPEIALAHPKELNFFDDAQKFKLGLNWYQKHFHQKKSRLVLGEFTSSYLYSQKAAERIKQSFPDVKLIVCLRNPIDRHFSHQAKKPLDRGLYFKHLSPYFNLFPRENILVMVYEDIAKNPQAFISQIYQFLGVDYSFKPGSLFKTINPQKKYKLGFIKKALDKIITFLESKKWGVSLKRVLIKLGFRKLFYAFDKSASVPVQKTEIAQAEKEKLRDFYRQDVKQLEQLLNRNLWPDLF